MAGCLTGRRPPLAGQWAWKDMMVQENMKGTVLSESKAERSGRYPYRN
jgi:hypothetical protein